MFENCCHSSSKRNYPINRDFFERRHFVGMHDRLVCLFRLQVRISCTRLTQIRVLLLIMGSIQMPLHEISQGFEPFDSLGPGVNIPRTRKLWWNRLESLMESALGQLISDTCGWYGGVLTSLIEYSWQILVHDPSDLFIIIYNQLFKCLGYGRAISVP